MSTPDAASNDEPAARVTIFRARSAPLLETTDMMAYPPPPPGIDLPPPTDGDTGAEVRVLFRQAERGGCSLVHAWFKANFMLPRHTHDADCLYYVISGAAHLGAQVLGPGDGFFVPAGRPYSYRAGPEGVEVLEFRNVSAFDMTVLETSPAVFQQILAVPEANREAWARMEVPPSWSSASASP